MSTQKFYINIYSGIINNSQNKNIIILALETISHKKKNEDLGNTVIEKKLESTMLSEKKPFV